MGGHTQEMYSGKMFDFDNFKDEDFCIDDIATHLSNICRFGGGVSKWYSVAEHSVRCSELLTNRGAHPEYVFGALMHDAHEAYVGDITTPVKRLFGHDYTALVARLDRGICRRFDINPDVLHSPGVQDADAIMLAIEAWYLTASGGEHVEWSHLQDVSESTKIRYQPAYWTPVRARAEFIDQWNAISTQRHLVRSR